MRYLLASLLMLSILLLGSDCEERRLEDLDRGRMVRDGLELRCCTYPATVAADATLEDPTVLEEAISTWNGWAGFEVLELAEGFDPDVTVAVGFAGYEDELGVAFLSYNDLGCIISCEIVLSSDVAYDRPTLLQTLRHELGHGPLGLDDDPGPPETVDLQSVMSRPLDPLGVLTEHDRELL